MKRQSEQHPSMNDAGRENAAIGAGKEAKANEWGKMTKSELESIYADAESRLKVLESNIKQLSTDVERIEIGLEEGDLSLDEFVDDIRRKRDEIDHAIAAQKPLYRALYLISKKIEAVK